MEGMERKVSLTPQEEIDEALDKHVQWLKEREGKIASKKVDFNLHSKEHSTPPLSHNDVTLPDFRSKASGEGLDRELERVDGEWVYKDTMEQ